MNNKPIDQVINSKASENLKDKIQKQILEDNRELYYGFSFIMYEELQPENIWYMTFGRGMPHLRKVAVRIPAWLGKILVKL